MPTFRHCFPELSIEMYYKNDIKKWYEWILISAREYYIPEEEGEEVSFKLNLE